MPVHRGKDSKGCYYQWGNQKKYYYKMGNVREGIIAKLKAANQGRAIMVSKYKVYR